MLRNSLRLLERYLPQRRPLRVLDAGCGTGGALLALQRYGQAAGFDFSPLAVGFCRQRGLTATALGSVTDVPFADQRFDVVTSFEVLYHANVPDDLTALREFRRVLRPGGVLLLRLPAFEWLRSSHDAMVHTRRRYTRGEVRRALVAAGFRPARVTYANSLLFPAVAGLRLLQRALGRSASKASDVQETPPLLNLLLLAVLALEGKLLALTDLPAGLSVLAIAQRPEQ
jgi:SAM-dependent methyltransferase